MRRTIACLLLVAVALPLAARADLQVGTAAPDIEAKSWLHLDPDYFDRYFPGDKAVSIKELRGMVIVLYFWVTYHPGGEYTLPLMTQVENSPNLGRERGVFIMGVTDADPSRVRPMLEKEKTFIPVACESKSGEEYRIPNFPHVVIIDANGKIAWAGWPGEKGGEALVKAVLDVVAKTPPTKTHPVEAARVQEKLSEAREGLRHEDFRKAFKAAAEANDHAIKGDKLKTQCQDVVDLIEALARDQMAQAEKLVRQNKYAEGMAALKLLMRQYRGTDAYELAQTRMEALSKDSKEIAEILEQQQHLADANAALAKALDDLRARRFGPAYEALEKLMEQYKGIDVADDAQKVIDRMKQNESVMKIVRDHKAKKPCEQLFSKANNYRISHQPEKAEEVLRQIIREYGDTSYAERARQELLGLR